MEFKDFKEKQKYYSKRAKEGKMVWVSKEPLNSPYRDKKGKTYVKPKEEK